MPTDALVRPFPSELTTPPVTNICLVMARTFLARRLGACQWAPSIMAQTGILTLRVLAEEGHPLPEYAAFPGKARGSCKGARVLPNSQLRNQY